MSKRKIHPAIYFILGLALGIGFGLYIGLQSNGDIEASTIIINKESSRIATDTTHKKCLPKKKKKKRRKKPTIHKKEVISIDSTNTDSIKADTNSMDSIINQDSAVVNTNIDSSVSKDAIPTKSITEDTNIDSKSFIDTQLINNEDIVIAEDELIYSEYIIPKGKKNDFLCKTDGRLDSILTNNITTRDQDGIFVEFWRSPLNSTGYKLSNNTLVLYGFYQYKSVTLEYLKNRKLRIQYLSDSFEISCNDEFVSLQISK